MTDLDRKLNKVNAQLLKELEGYNETKENIERLAQLTILALQSKGYQMGNNKKPPIEVDEVINNEQMLSNEYDITFNQENGKLFIAHNGNDSQVILQAIAYNMHPDRKNLAGLLVDKNQPPIGRDGRLSGIFYFEKLPVDLMEKLPDIAEPVVVKEDKTEKKIDISKEYETNEKEYDSLEAYDKDHKTGGDDDPYGLIKSNPKTLKAPTDLSRAGRKEWWENLRKVHPTAFDKGGNWIGFDTVEEPAKAATSAPVQRGGAIGLLTETGAGNLITSIIDARVNKDTVFIGRYFQQRNGFVVASTPAKDGESEISAMIFFEKMRTANTVLEGLLKSPTWDKKLEGCRIFLVTNLKPEIRVDNKRRIYFVTNAVTALKALGTQKKPTDAQAVDYVEVKD